MRQLQHKVIAALSIGFVGFMDFRRDRNHPYNKGSHLEFAGFRELHYYREWHNQLLFLCALHRLQQLAPEAVLARLHFFEMLQARLVAAGYSFWLSTVAC